MQKRKIELPTQAAGIEKAEEVVSSINERSLVPGKIDPEVEKRSEPIINTEANLEKIQAPRFQYRGTNRTVGRPKDFLKARKKRQRMAKQSRKKNRKKK